MKQRPILFSAPMVRALLDGSKTQTRRAWRVQPPPGVKIGYSTETKSPHGQVGDQLWVRETWSPGDEMVFNTIKDDPETVLYRADKSALGWDGKAMTIWYDTFAFNWEVMKWKPSIFMPRWASRIALEITSVRVERLQDISEADAIAEGIERCDDYPTLWKRGALRGDQNILKATGFPRLAYRSIWESINGADSWAANPWVWVIEFKRIGAPA